MVLNLQRFSHTEDHVDVVQLTEENLEEVAAWCGGDVKQTEVEDEATKEIVVTRLGVTLVKSSMKFATLHTLNIVFIGDLLLRHLDDNKFSIRQLDTFAKFYRPGGAVGFEEATLDKVRVALEEVGLDRLQQLDAINAMQNKGILFRERIN